MQRTAALVCHGLSAVLLASCTTTSDDAVKINEGATSAAEDSDNPATASLGSDETTTTSTEDAGAACEFGLHRYSMSPYDEEQNCFAGAQTRTVTLCARDHGRIDGLVFCDQSIGYAVAPDGTCWAFPNLCFPAGWTDITAASEADHVCASDQGIECEPSTIDASVP